MQSEMGYNMPKLKYINQLFIFVYEYCTVYTTINAGNFHCATYN